jgi:hypothetical protein
MTQLKIKPKTITESDQAGKRIMTSTGKYFKSYSKCRDGDAQPAYHWWEKDKLKNFINGGTAQCGKPSKYSCNLKNKGYRNTCPIAGICGTFNQPASIFVLDFNFSENKVNEKIKINALDFSYEHKVTGVDVKTGKEYSRWGGDFPYVILNLYTYKTSDKNIMDSLTLKQTRKTTNAIPIGKYGTVKEIFTETIEIDPLIENIAVEIKYPMQGDGVYKTKSTNPSIIYIEGLDINLDYTNISTPVIKTVLTSYNTNGVLITDSRNPNLNTNNCRNQITHSLQALNQGISNYSNTDNIKVNNRLLPPGLRYTESIEETQKINGVQSYAKIFKWEDISGIPDIKNVRYYIENTDQVTVVPIDVVKPKEPTIWFTTSYIKGTKQIPYMEYVNVIDGCMEQLTLYFDSLQDQPLVFNKVSKEGNLIYDKTDEFNCNVQYFNKLKSLDCGKHVLYAYLDGKYYHSYEITIKPQPIEFEINYNYDEDRTDYIQSRSTEESSHSISLKRVDDVAIDNVKVNLIDTTNDTVTEENFKKYNPNPGEGESDNLIVYQINLTNSGEYKLTLEYDNGCYIASKTFPIIIKPKHKTYYNNLLIQCKKSNSNDKCTLDYKSIVIREGDQINYPVCIQDIQEMNNPDDIILYSKDAKIGLSTIGYTTLKVKNTSSMPINNLYVELNPFTINDDEIDPLITEWTEGMFKNFYRNFFDLNPQLYGLVDVVNAPEITEINDDNIESEDVMLNFINIDALDTMEVKIPFMYQKYKKINLQFIILDEVKNIIDLDSKEERSFVELVVNDLILNDLSITGDLDINNNDQNCQGNIIYTLKNIDTIETNQSKRTRVINSPEMIPIAYKKHTDSDFIDIELKDGVYQTLNKDITVVRKEQDKNIPLGNETLIVKTLNEDQKFNSHNIKTDINGIANFSYMIPMYYGNKQYSIQDLLDQLVRIEYMGNNIYKPSQIGKVSNLPISNMIIFGIDKNDEWVDQSSTANSSDIVYLYIQLVDRNNKGIEDFISYDDAKIHKQYKVHNIDYEDQNIDHIPNSILDGFCKIKIPITNDNVIISDVIKNDVFIYYNGNNTYNSCSIGNKDIVTNKHKQSDTNISVLKTYKKYLPNAIVPLKIKLTSNVSTFQNYIDFNQQLDDDTYSNTVKYNMCSNTSKDVYTTTYKTFDDTLVDNKIIENVYCNVPTTLDVKAKIQQGIIEANNVNILLINVNNGSKPNKDVELKIYIGRGVINTGDYDIVETVNIIDGTYSYDENTDIITWHIGEMEANETKECIIKVLAEAIGNNVINIDAYDYLTPPEELMKINTHLELLSSVVPDGNKLKCFVGDDIEFTSYLKDSDNKTINSNESIYYINEDTDKIIKSSDTERNINTGERKSSIHISPIINGTLNVKAKYPGKTTDSALYSKCESNSINIEVSKIQANILFMLDNNTFPVNRDILINMCIKNLDNIIIDPNKKISILLDEKEIEYVYDKKTGYYSMTIHPTTVGSHILKAVISEDNKYMQSSEQIELRIL